MSVISPVVSGIQCFLGVTTLSGPCSLSASSVCIDHCFSGGGREGFNEDMTFNRETHNWAVCRE